MSLPYDATVEQWQEVYGRMKALADKRLELLKKLEKCGHPDIYRCPCCQGEPFPKKSHNFFEEEEIIINHYDDCELAKALVSEQREDELE